MLPRLLAPLVATAALALATPAAAFSPEANVLEHANKLRASLGMGPLTMNAEYSRGCDLHNRYIILTGGDANAHEETEGRRGYTKAGHWAGLRSNLAGSGPRDPNPWINAPYHLIGMLDPNLRETGIAFTRGRNRTQWCMWVSTHELANGDAFFSYPADGGKAPRAQIVREAPSTPAYDLGLKTPSRTVSSKTGPNILVHQQSIDGYQYCRLVLDDETDAATYYDRATGQVVDGARCGPLVLGLDIMSSATMTGPDGPVTIRYAKPDGPGFHARRGIIVPVKPLKAGGRYTVSVTFSTDPTSGGGAPRSVTNTFTFTATKKTLR